MYVPRLAWRYLFARRIHLVGIAGVAVGVTALVVVLSVMNGFIQETRRVARGSLADAIVTPAPSGIEIAAPFEAYARVLRGIPEVGAFAPRYNWYALVAAGGRQTNLLRSSTTLGARNGVQLIGIDPAAEKDVTLLPQALRNPPLEATFDSRVADPDDPFAAPLDALDPRDRESPPPSVVVGEQLFHALRLRRGQRIGLLTGVYDSGTRSFKSTNRHFVVAGTFRTGEYEYDLGTILLSRQVLAGEFLETRQDFSEVVVRLVDPEAGERAVRVIAERLAAASLPGTRGSDDAHDGVPPEEIRDGPDGPVHDAANGVACGLPIRRSFVDVETWMERKRILLGAIDNEKRIMAVILFFIVLVATFLLFALLTTTVKEKTRDIGILAALGATPGGIRAVFLALGLSIALLGEGLGLAAGLAITSNLQSIERVLREQFGLVIFRPDIYIFDHLPCEVDALGVVAILASTFLSALLFTSIPAWRASRKDPVAALRYE